MTFASTLVAGLIQASVLPDTIVARTVPVRGIFEYSSGILQILVLLLGVEVQPVIRLKLVVHLELQLPGREAAEHRFHVAGLKRTADRKSVV